MSNFDNFLNQDNSASLIIQHISKENDNDDNDESAVQEEDIDRMIQSGYLEDIGREIMKKSGPSDNELDMNLFRKMNNKHEGVYKHNLGYLRDLIEQKLSGTVIEFSAQEQEDSRSKT